MKTMQVANLKSNFSEILKEVKNGSEIIISYGRKKEKIAVIIPYSNYKNKKIKMGLLKGKAKMIMHKDFEISEEEFLGL